MYWWMEHLPIYKICRAQANTRESWSFKKCLKWQWGDSWVRFWVPCVRPDTEELTWKEKGRAGRCWVFLRMFYWAFVLHWWTLKVFSPRALEGSNLTFPSLQWWVKPDPSILGVHRRKTATGNSTPFIILGFSFLRLQYRYLIVGAGLKSGHWNRQSTPCAYRQIRECQGADKSRDDQLSPGVHRKGCGRPRL